MVIGRAVLLYAAQKNGPPPPPRRSSTSDRLFLVMLQNSTRRENNEAQLDLVRSGRGFIAALDQSGGSTPKALKSYGLGDDAYHGDDEMFDRMHEMRSRIITSPAFDADRILGAILFENTMDRDIEGYGAVGLSVEHEADRPLREG